MAKNELSEHVDNVTAVKAEADSMIQIGGHGAAADNARRFSLLSDAVLALARHVQKDVKAAVNPKPITAPKK